MFTTSPVTIPSPALRSRAQRDDGLARRDGGAHRDLEPFGAQLLDRVEDPERRAHRPLGIVLVCDGRAEDCHHRVADELLHRPAEALDVGLHALVVRAKRRADVLGVGPVGAAREPDEVDEEHGDDLALLAGRRLHGERLPTGKAEARSLGVFLPAVWADHHFADLRSGRASTRPEGDPAALLRPRAPRPRQDAAGGRCATTCRSASRPRRRPGGARCRAPP